MHHLRWPAAHRSFLEFGYYVVAIPFPECPARITEPNTRQKGKGGSVRRLNGESLANPEPPTDSSAYQVVAFSMR